MQAVEFETMKNLGPVSASWLQQAGIETRAALEELGPVVVFQRVKQFQPKVSLNLLWALAAALMDKDCRELTAAERIELHSELRRMETRVPQSA
jgi:hypothetical protein